MCAADQDPGAAVCGADLKDEDLDTVCRAKVLAGNLFFFIEHAVSLAQIDADVPSDISLYNTGDDIALFFNIIIVDDAALFLADLLHDHVLRDLCGNTSEAFAVDINIDNISDLGALLNFHCVIQGDLLEIVFHLFRCCDDSLLGIT